MIRLTDPEAQLPDTSPIRVSTDRIQTLFHHRKGCRGMASSILINQRLLQVDALSRFINRPVYRARGGGMSCVRV